MPPPTMEAQPCLLVQSEKSPGPWEGSLAPCGLVDTVLPVYPGAICSLMSTEARTTLALDQVGLDFQAMGNSQNVGSRYKSRLSLEIRKSLSPLDHSSYCTNIFWSYTFLDIL
jgi:hypothetical protein